MKRLTPEAEADNAAFSADGYPNCSCHLSPPCSSCTHPGNPLNQAEDPECWVTQNIHLSLAAYPRHSAFHGMMRATTECVSEPFLGPLCLDHVQICPQNTGVLLDEYVDNLVAAFPRTQFRLHANARVQYARQVVDLDRFDPASSYWRTLRDISARLKAPAYTAHAGLQVNCNLRDVLDNTRRAEDFMGIPVGIEGHYPTSRSIYLLDTWHDYGVMLKSGVKYALDLSHLQILAKQTQVKPTSLIQELLASEHCIEVHVSNNDGRRDSHELLNEEPWWWPLMASIHPNAIIFSEGTQPDVRSP